MAKARLNKKLLDKIANKCRTKHQAIRVRVSKKANKLGVSSEAALAILAKELGIGTASYQRKLDSTKQTEIRDSLPAIIAQASPMTRQTSTNSFRKGRKKTDRRTPLKTTIEYLIVNDELRARCTDLLLGRAKFDRAINQATLVLEDRIRQKSNPPSRLVGDQLVCYAFNPDLAKTRFKVSNDPEEQAGFFFILKGVVPAFRNITHHHLTESFSREESLRICSFIDVLLRVVDGAQQA